MLFIIADIFLNGHMVYILLFYFFVTNY